MATTVTFPTSIAAWQRVFVYLLFVSATFSIAGSEAATILLYALGLAHWWRAESVDAPPAWLIAPFVAVLAVSLLSALSSEAPVAALDNVRGDYRLFLPFALLPALGAVDRRRLLGTFALFVILFGLYGVVQHYVGIDLLRPAGQEIVRPYHGRTFHAVGNFTHHQTFAGVMVIAVPLFWGVALCDRHRLRLLWAAAGLGAALGVLGTMARSAWLGMAAGVVALGYCLPRRWSIPATVVVVALLVALGVGLGTGWLRQAAGDLNRYPDIVKRVLETSPTGFDKDRLYLWEAGWLGIRDNPWLGVGPGNDAIAFEAYRQVVSQRHDGYTFTTGASAGLHNLYLQLWFERGLLGLLAHLWLMLTVLVWCGLWLVRAGRAFALERGLLWGCVGGLVASMVAAVFENNFFDAEVQVMIVLAVSLAVHAGMTIRRGARLGTDATARAGRVETTPTGG